MNFINKIVNTFVLSVVLVSFAQAETLVQTNKSLDQLVERLSKINTFSGTFIQYSVDQKGARVQESSGELKADRSGMFYWHTSEPLEQTVVSDGQQVTVYDPDLEQATIQSVGEQVQTTPAILFSGNTDKIGDMFHVETRMQVGQSIQFSLKPKNNESLFERLIVRFEGVNLQELRILDALGQESTMSFIQTQINPSFSEDTFSISLPEDTDIIRDIPSR